jgi:hypothetical protein
MVPNIITLVLITVSALGALGAAIAAWKSARETRRAAEGQLFSDFYVEYGTPEMLRSLRILRNWKANNGNEFEIAWKKKLDEDDEDAHKVDRARRHVKFYFLRALRLYESGYVSIEFLKGVCAVDGINILYDIVEPLEFALNPAFDRSKFNRLRQFCGRAGTGRLIPPVPPGPKSP